MKSLLLITLCALSFNVLHSQCDDLFFSEYVEGYANNKALEIYNPTDQAVDLSGYSIARASNGSTSPASDQIISLPNVMLESKDVFVVVLDMRDTSLWDSQLDKPAWNGYNLIDTLYDAITGLPITDSDGNVIIGPQYTENGNAIFGNEYNEEYDLQCKADAFLCPEYEVNNTMYFNGNDAMILIRGSQISSTGDNIVDVIGVIGEDPEDTIMEDAWVNADGFWVTKNRTLVRSVEIETGRNALNEIVFQLGGSFMGEGWDSYSNNSFEFLGIHNSVCNNESQPDRYSCSTGPITSTYQTSDIPFKIFPNPTNTNFINISTDENISSIEIYDLMGRKVIQKANFNQRGGDIDLSEITRGTYMVRIEFSNKEWSISKIVIQ